MGWVINPEAWVALAALTTLEIILGVDNIIFISILVGRLPQVLRQKARVLGLSIAMAARIVLLLLISWIMRLEETLFSFFDLEISGRDVILIAGGLFLIAKATLEIHDAVEGIGEHQRKVRPASFLSVLAQITVIDLVFSLDSVITAVGMADDLGVMIVAIVLAVLVMMFSAGAIGRFVDERPTVKMLALSFLVLIGIALVAEGIGFHIPKGYIYFAMAFSVVVELLNLRIRGRGRAVGLHKKPMIERLEASGET
jgi:predicted tellurium resistance membrane protein TerC